jgi:hypothetical protein
MQRQQQEKQVMRNAAAQRVYAQEQQQHQEQRVAVVKMCSPQLRCSQALLLPLHLRQQLQLLWHSCWACCGRCCSQAARWDYLQVAAAAAAASVPI